MRRRTLLTAAAGLATAGFAGCLNTPSDPGDTPTDTPEPTDSGPHPVTPTDREFSVLSRECGEGANAATVDVAGGTVTVNGTVGGSDACDIAVLDALELHDGTLTATVAARPEPTTDTPACAQCLTDIEYRLTVELGDAPLDRVVVVHRSGGETLTVADEPA